MIEISRLLDGSITTDVEVCVMACGGTGRRCGEVGLHRGGDKEGSAFRDWGLGSRGCGFEKGASGASDLTAGAKIRSDHV